MLLLFFLFSFSGFISFLHSSFIFLTYQLFFVIESASWSLFNLYVLICLFLPYVLLLSSNLYVFMFFISFFHASFTFLLIYIYGRYTISFFHTSFICLLISIKLIFLFLTSLLCLFLYLILPLFLAPSPNISVSNLHSISFLSFINSVSILF